MNRSYVTCSITFRSIFVHNFWSVLGWKHCQSAVRWYMVSKIVYFSHKTSNVYLANLLLQHNLFKMHLKEEIVPWSIGWTINVIVRSKNCIIFIIIFCHQFLKHCFWDLKAYCLKEGLFFANYSFVLNGHIPVEQNHYWTMLGGDILLPCAFWL